MSPMSLIAAQAKYGEIHNMTWGEESRHCAIWTMPEDLAPGYVQWINTATGSPVERIYCLKDMHWPLERALALLITRGLDFKLKTFDGCKNMRMVRGNPNLISAHAYGGALDVNALTNPLGGPGDMDPGIVECFIKAGFTWGGSFKRPDPQHFSFLGW